MAYGLCEPRLIDGIVVVIGIRKWAFFHEDFTAVGQPETSLVDVLMIVEWTRTHHKNEVVRFPTFFEYRSSDIAEYFDRILVKWRILRNILGIEHYVFVCRLIVIPEPFESITSVSLARCTLRDLGIILP